MTRSVLTGPPCSGKTAVSSAIAAAMPHIAVVPEAATQVYEADGTRWDSLDLAGRNERQRRIYQLQLRQEEAFARRHPDKSLLLDRGTLDGAAYWPDGPDAYWHEMKTTREIELARYDRVIFLETAATIGIYGLDSNAARFEEPADAIANGKRLFNLWCAHPNIITIPAFPSLADKIAAVKAILNKEPF